MRLQRGARLTEARIVSNCEIDTRVVRLPNIALSLLVRPIVAIIATLPLPIGGCAMGPNFRPPIPPPSSTPLAPVKLDRSRRSGITYVESLAIPERWWELFHCSALNSIVTRAIASNPDLQAARHALRAADANMQAARGSLFPQIGASANASA